VSQAITYVKVELLNIDGSMIGWARIKPVDRISREALFATFGEAGYQVDIPSGPKGDKRCPYQIRLAVE
jgi:hypothetical protein